MLDSFPRDRPGTYWRGKMGIEAAGRAILASGNASPNLVGTLVATSWLPSLTAVVPVVRFPPVQGRVRVGPPKVVNRPSMTLKGR
jgi:hypothetical protein